jgi:integrase
MKIKRWNGFSVTNASQNEAKNLFKDLPAEGLLFPYLSRVRANDRATEFRSRCRQLGIQGVTLHSYRYAWAERAKTVGYPERFAQEALGHNSKAVHRAYAKRALMKIPSLEEYEREAALNVKSTGRRTKFFKFSFSLFFVALVYGIHIYFRP